jgi:hypothetical protein
MQWVVAAMVAGGAHASLAGFVGWRPLFGSDAAVYGVNSPDFGLQFPPSRPRIDAYSADIVMACARAACAMHA